MNAWRVCAFGAFEREAGDSPDDLRAELKSTLSQPPRRVNRFIRLALLGAHRCIRVLNGPLPEQTSLYVTSEQGPVADTVDAMEGMIHRGLPVMPMTFINLSPGMAGFYVAAMLGLGGRSVSVARDREGFGALFDLAALYTGASDVVLLGSVAECVWPLAEHRARCRQPPDTPLAEGSYWIVADRSEQAGPRLWRETVGSRAEARAWLADAESWYVSPHLPVAERERLCANLDANRGWRPPLGHCFHPEAVAHAVYHALKARPVPLLHMVTGRDASGYRLLRLG